MLQKMYGIYIYLHLVEIYGKYIGKFFQSHSAYDGIGPPKGRRNEPQNGPPLFAIKKTRSLRINKGTPLTTLPSYTLS